MPDLEIVVNSATPITMGIPAFSDEHDLLLTDLCGIPQMKILFDGVEDPIMTIVGNVI